MSWSLLGPVISNRPGREGSSASGLQAAATTGSAAQKPARAVGDLDADVASDGGAPGVGEEHTAVLGLAAALGGLALME